MDIEYLFSVDYPVDYYIAQSYPSPFVDVIDKLVTVLYDFELFLDPMFTPLVGSADLGLKLVDSPPPRAPPSSTQRSQESKQWNNPGDSFSTIIEQNDAFTILKGRSELELWKYVNLSDEELAAIIKLRLLVHSTGIDLLTHKFCDRS